MKERAVWRVTKFDLNTEGVGGTEREREREVCRVTKFYVNTEGAVGEGTEMERGFKSKKV